MTKNQTDLLEGIPQLLALAGRFEAEGQVNLSKLLEATVYSRLRRAARQFQPVITADNMHIEFDMALELLKRDDLNPELLATLELGRRILADEHVPLIQDAPDFFVCRTCGSAAPGQAPDRCPGCGAWTGGFRKFVGTFNGDNTEPLNPLEVVTLLTSNAAALKMLVEGLSQEEMNRRPAEQAWAIHQHVAHFRDAQETLETRVNLMLTQDNPELVVVALYDMATEASASSTSDLLADYLDRRTRLVAQLETLPLRDFWRPGWHQEFGSITILRQLAYMANHEQSHFPDIEALRNQILDQR
jgi:hypothetical protein